MASILVVDDSKTDRHVVGSMLCEVDEYEVKFAENGKEALSEMQRNVPDLVVTDLFMPEVDGLELVSRTRREFPLVPVVLITSKGSEELAVQALQQGAASYVPKRLLSRYLVETVASLLAAVKEQRSRATLLGTMRSDACEFSLSNDVQLAHALVGYILESMAHIGIGDETARLRTCVALEEALVNAINHGNLEVASALRQEDGNAYYDLIKQRRPKPPYCHRRVQVHVKMNEIEAEFVIRDEGPGFDVATLPDPRDPENLEKASGRGVMLMRTFMDEVNYNAKGNMVTMIKRAERIKNDKDACKILRADHKQGVLIVTVLTDVTSLGDEELARELEDVLHQLQGDDTRHVIIDLQGVVRFGSSFLETLRRIWNVSKVRNGKFALCNVSDIGREILAVSKYDSVWLICSTMEEALASIVE